MIARLAWLALVALLAAAFWTAIGWVIGLSGLPSLFDVVFVLTFVVMLFFSGAKTGNREGQ